MFNIFKKTSFIICIFLTSFIANANLIQDINYITVDHGNGELIDWAWASSSNVEYIYVTEFVNGQEVQVLDNHFFAPETILGWRLASTSEFNYFLNNIFLSDFTKADGSFITAHSFWNTNDTAPNSDDFNLRDITSTWVENSVLDFNRGLMPDNYWFDTFYVRTHQDVQSVPEPTTLLIFSLGLIALVTRKKMRK